MAETIVNLVLAKLADVTVQEVLHLYGVHEKVETVSRELTQIQAILKDADKKQIKDERQIKWVEEVRDIAYRIEDAIDTFLMDIPQKSGLRATIRKMLRKNKKLPVVHNFVNEMNLIQEKMKETEDSRVRYGIDSLGEGSTRDIELPDQQTKPTDTGLTIVGRKADQDRIVKEFFDETTKRRSVVSILGIGGIGKTTLAKKIYNCSDVKEQFEVRIWVAISSMFKMIDVLKKIMGQVNPSIKLSESKAILREIYKSLRGKKYLIVLDDVWTIDLWRQIGAAFPDENNGSRVLITTRILNVSEEMDPYTNAYFLSFLNEELSWEVFLKTVFPNHDLNKNSFDDLSDIIGQFVHKCGGLPLALVVLGGFLSKKPRSHAIWNSVFRTMNEHEEIFISRIIDISYQDLPFAQKSCFMFFAAFPEDYTIDAPSLLRMWIAEGFILQEDNKTLEKTAESFLEDLVQRNMVQVERRSFDGSIKTLCIHDLLREFALIKAKEENFLLVFSHDPDDKMSLSSARRLAIHDPDCDELIMSPNLHTLLFFCNRRMPNCSKQRLLKVVSNKNDEDSIIELGMFEGLTQLRYLNLSGMLSDNRDQEFFEKVIGRMKFLQTLHISCLSNFEFPKSAWNIKTLRHLCHDMDTIELPASAKLTNLQTISRVWATHEINLPHIPNLHSLELLAMSSVKAVVNFLSTLEHLTYLSITHGHSVLDIFDMREFPFYNHLQSLKLHYISPTKLTQLLHKDMLPYNLIYLDIKGYKFQEDIMPVLEKLRRLQVLILNKASQSQKVSCSSVGFSQLEVLNLFTLSMDEWEIEEGAMPILKELEIFDCVELGVPQGLKYLTNLQKLEWQDVGNSKANLVRNLCQHVPSIYLGGR